MRTRLSSKFNRCVKSVKKTVRARKGSNKESAAIAICTKSVLQKRGRTIKSYSRKRLITQKKFRGGGTPVSVWKMYADRVDTTNQNDPLPELQQLSQDILSDSSLPVPPTGMDEEYADNLFIAALKNGSKPLVQALYQKGISKEFMLRNIDSILSQGISPESRSTLKNLRGFVANLS